MSTPQPSSRREFLKTGAAAGIAAPYVVGASALGQEGQPAPSERIGVGLIGCGGMGRGNLGNCARHTDVAVTGACDVWAPRRNAVVGQFKASCKPYSDYREMIAAKDVDAVIIGTPPHWHTLPAIAAATSPSCAPSAATSGPTVCSSCSCSWLIASPSGFVRAASFRLSSFCCSCIFSRSPVIWCRRRGRATRAEMHGVVKKAEKAQEKAHKDKWRKQSMKRSFS